jgi:hypothetical protein
MPIPADASLTGVTLFAQSFQLEASNAFGATPGAQFTLL